MPAIEATKQRMNQAFEPGQKEDEGDSPEQEAPVIDLTGLSDHASSGSSANGTPNTGAIGGPTASSSAGPSKASRTSNFAPTGLRVHQAFDHGLKQHSVGHRPRSRYTADRIRQLVNSKLQVRA